MEVWLDVGKTLEDSLITRDGLTVGTLASAFCLPRVDGENCRSVTIVGSVCCLSSPIRTADHAISWHPS